MVHTKQHRSSNFCTTARRATTVTCRCRKTPAPKSTSATQSSLLAFFKPPIAKSGAKRKCDHQTVLPEKRIKKSEEKRNVDDKKGVAPQKTSTTRKFLPQWQEQFSWVVHHEDEHKMTCKTCCAFPHLAGKTEFVSGCRTFKKESLQKHSIGGGHYRSRDAWLAQQKPVLSSPILQGLQKGGKSCGRENKERD